MSVIGRECNHTSVSGDMTEERESVRERVNERDYVRNVHISRRVPNVFRTRCERSAVRIVSNIYIQQKTAMETGTHIQPAPVT